MNKGSILKCFLYCLLAFLIFYIEQIPTIYLGVKDIRLVCLLIFVLLLSNSTNQEIIENAHMNPFLLITFTVIMAPIVEELVFRGLLMGRVFNPDSIVGLIVSSLLFGLVHMPNSIGVWIVYAGMGLALGIAYRKFQKLEYCIMAHIINNSIAFQCCYSYKF